MNERSGNDDDLGAEGSVCVDIDATVDEVWTALTTDAGLAEWMGAGSTLGPSVGGLVHFADVATGRERTGRLDELQPRERVAYTWWPEDEPELVTNVNITLEPTETGTRVTVKEQLPVATASASTAPAAPLGAAWSWRMALVVLAAQSFKLVLSCG